jgi:hypothetical protein
MSIKRFLFLVFIVLISLAIFLNVKYLNSLEIERKNQPIEDYSITEIWCHNSSKMSSNMTIGFKGKKYFVSLPSKICIDIQKKIIKPKLYYNKNEDLVFYEGQYLPFPYVYLTYIAAFILPLLGFIIYRKELDKHYSTM